MGVRTRRLLGLLAIPVSVVVGLTTGLAVPSAAAPTRVIQDPPPAAVPQRYLAQQVSWHTCPFDQDIKDALPSAPTTRCAAVVVPMDWLHPDAHPDIKVAIAWSRATGTSHGVLAENPGGPGVPGLDQTAVLGTVKPKLFASYDLLGFDPRGYGDSTETTCSATQADDDARRSVIDPRVRDVKTHQVEVANAKFFGTACSLTEFSQFVSTQQTVYDMDFLRRFLGHDEPVYRRLNFVGVSYGTWLGAWYADTYPTHTGRFLLDSNMNWTSTMYANQLTDPFSFQRRRDLMFFPWVARHSREYGFGKSAAEVKKNYELLRQRLVRASRSGDSVDDPADFDDTVAVYLFADRTFADAMEYLAFVDEDTPLANGAARDAKARKPASARRVQALLSRNAAGRSSPEASNQLVDVDSGDFAVRCNDSPFSRDLTTLLKRADSDARKFPFVGYFDTVTMCNYWKYAPVSRTINLTGAPTLLMTQSEGDPATAYEGAQAAHRATATHTRLVSIDNEGEHGVYAFGVSSCVDRIGDAFLLDGTLPSQDATCAGRPLPGDSKVYPLDGPLDGHPYPLDSGAQKTSARQAKASRDRQQSKLDVAAQSVG